MNVILIGSGQRSRKDHIVVLFALSTGLSRVTGQAVLVVMDVGRARITLSYRLQCGFGVIQNRHCAHAGTQKSRQRTVIGTHLKNLRLRLEVIPLKQQFPLGREGI